MMRLFLGISVSIALLTSGCLPRCPLLVLINRQRPNLLGTWKIKKTSGMKFWVKVFSSTRLWTTAAGFPTPPG